MKTTVEHIIKEECYYDSLNKSAFKTCEKQVISYSTKFNEKEIKCFTVEVNVSQLVKPIKELEVLEYVLSRYKNQSDDVTENQRPHHHRVKSKEATPFSDTILKIITEPSLTEEKKIQVIERLVYLEGTKRYQAKRSLEEECDKIINSFKVK